MQGMETNVGRLDPWMWFSIDEAFYNLELWRLITFQFMQWDLWHLFGNMLGLYFFGYMIEHYLGHARFIAFYLVCGIGGVVGYLFFSLAGLMQFDTATPMAGASAGIFGILIGAVFLAPETRVYVLFFPMKLKVLAWCLLIYGAYTVLTDGRNAGGEAAHLGGAAFGFLLIRKPELLGWAVTIGNKVTGNGPRIKTTRSRSETSRGTAGRIRPDQTPPSQGPSVDQREVDRILGKIGREGINSLTPQERATLNEASRQ